MKVTLLPSSVAAAGEEPRQFLTSYLINDTVALDAGCVGLFGPPREQARIRHVLISHTHIDHLASLPIFLDNIRGGTADGVTIYGSDAVLECLQQDIFNDRIWPNFIGSSATAEVPYLKLARLEPGQAVELEGLRIIPVAVHHPVPTLGFVVEDPAAAVVFSSDTGPTDEIWEYANAAPNLKAVFLEATFPDAMTRLAEVAQHLTPALLAGEVRKLKRQVPIIAVHIKARFREQVIRELQALGMPHLEIGQFGKPYHF